MCAHSVFFSDGADDLDKCSFLKEQTVVKAPSKPLQYTLNKLIENQDLENQKAQVLEEKIATKQRNMQETRAKHSLCSVKYKVLALSRHGALFQWVSYLWSPSRHDAAATISYVPYRWAVPVR